MVGESFARGYQSTYEIFLFGLEYHFRDYMISSSKVFQKTNVQYHNFWGVFFLERVGLKIILTSDSIIASVDIEEGSDNLQARTNVDCAYCRSLTMV